MATDSQVPVADALKPSQRSAAQPRRGSRPTKSSRLLSLIPASLYAFVIYYSITAIVDSHSDPSTIFFVASSLSVLVLLYVSMREFERAVAKDVVKMDHLKIAIWLLATLLNLLFSYHVTSVFQSPVMTGVIWGIAAVTSLIGCLRLFLLPHFSTANEETRRSHRKREDRSNFAFMLLLPSVLLSLAVLSNLLFSYRVNTLSGAAPLVNATAQPELSDVDARNTCNMCSVPPPSTSFTAILHFKGDTVPVFLLLMASLSSLSLMYLMTRQRLNFASYMPLLGLTAVHSCLCLASARPTDEQPSTPVDVGDVSILDILLFVGSSVSILGILYLATKKLERVVASEDIIRKNRLKVAMLSLPMILTATFIFPVTSEAQKWVSTVVIWVVAAITCYTLLSGETTNEPPQG